MIAQSQRWQKTAMAAAAVAVLGLWGSHASALSLGRMTVLSALGEPLRAEIDIPDINAEEAASLKTTVALPEAYQAAGIEYNPALRGLQMTLQRKPDGHAFILVNSDRAMNDPFVDLILEASWSSGRIVRDYTMLFDPPNLRQAQIVTVTAPQVSSAPASATPAQTPAASTPSASTRPAVPARTAPPPPTAETPARTPVASSKRVTIKSGDTASRIAAANKPAGVSLDQMLVALLRRNPDVFVDGNINRIKAGAVMNLPSAEQAQATPAHEASQIVVAQSRDFNDFRRKLAGSAPAAQVSAAARQASGRVQARVEDKKPAALTPDKLTLSKGAVQGQAGEDKIARERSARETASRAEELSKTVSELSKLGAASGAAAPAPAVSAPHAAPATVTTAVTAPVAAPPAPAVAPQITATSAAPTASPPKADASASVKRPAAPPIQAPEPSLLDELLENPLVSAAAAGLVALLAGFGFYRIRQRKHSGQVDSAFLESRLQPDSFFGASGGQRIDTNEAAGATGSSMMYSPSQLDAADDVDPVAEADVYLAYGRDLQAEEILKEALRIHPGRVAIHQKLLEICAKRRDIKAFENIAHEACKLTGGHGQDWERVRELGMEVDPSNALYQPGDHPVSAAAPAAAEAGAGSVASSTIPQTLQPRLPSTAAPVDLDLDLDFSLDDETSSALRKAGSSTAADASRPAIEPATPSLGMDFGLAAEALQAGEASRAGPDAESSNLPLPELPTQTDASPPAQTPSNSGMLEFDLGSLSLDLGTPSEQSVAASPDDPLATKLALAEEFSAIGDTDGARALLEEVIAEASGEMKAKAQSALSQL